ncbi:hypothetical protein RO3G_14176 [Rhizopus delemar RA 99-880]|uniref:Uncharacterized protein n=1 Tax=Rhizopus delemar (strain RA 99-880 / ATCC MYA-4621 / FGSC 9543 / NRRL 43880) TaxID=246409 RepID=I1CLY5_RHIO9|nr:hypothetical protein RO3G_14176 [Rhizopus delemar RA 99-880]|eukprot:EIE89465.1 hypothetical protein RO3G_14176 [Rhizopus delemar RA 99-880]
MLMAMHNFVGIATDVNDLRSFVQNMLKKIMTFNRDNGNFGNDHS